MDVTFQASKKKKNRSCYGAAKEVLPLETDGKIKSDVSTVPDSQGFYQYQYSFNWQLINCNCKQTNVESKSHEVEVTEKSDR
jgi:hypothetical protein